MSNTDIAMASEQARELAEAERTPAAITPLAMLNQAVANGAGIDVLERLMGLHERWEANQARKAFTEAFAAFKAEAVTVVRNRLVTDGPLKGKSYAELTAFVDAVTPALSKHDLTASWDVTKDEKDWIEVTCIIEHVLGGSKRVSLGGPPDAGGAKNAIQARASTVTYLERHTLKAACGLAEQGDDKDGRGDGDKITDDQAEELKAALEKAADDTAGDYGAWLESFLSNMKVESLADIPAKDFGKGKAKIASAVTAQKGQK